MLSWQWTNLFPSYYIAPQVDKNDLGAFRFNDPERNVIIASTDLPGLNKAPLVYESDSQNLRSKSNAAKKQKPHYSVSTHGEQLWGTHDVYTDDLTEEEVISLIVSYEWIEFDNLIEKYYRSLFKSGY